MKTKLRQPISISITQEESLLLNKLRENGITNIAVFRRGLKVFCEETVDSMTQNNIS